MYDVQSFCRGCGKHRRTLPFGKQSRFFDGGPCGNCGNDHYGSQFIARKRKTGGLFSKRDWFTPDGELVTLQFIQSQPMPYW